MKKDACLKPGSTILGNSVECREKRKAARTKKTKADTHTTNQLLIEAPRRVFGRRADDDDKRPVDLKREKRRECK